MDHLFKNRTEAGQLLAEKIKPLIQDKPYVFALPRGGVPTAAPIAKALGTEVDLLLVKKIKAPRHPEIALGAIAEEGPPLWQDHHFSDLQLDDSEKDRLLIKAQKALARQRRLWKTDSHVTNIKDHTVILVDDCLTSGTSADAAIQFLRTRKPGRIILAIPVAVRTALERIKSSVEHIVCLEIADHSQVIGKYYDDFTRVTDREVSEVLKPFHSLGF